MGRITPSGHYLADRRYDMALQFLERDEKEAAADLLQQVRELTPFWPPAIFKHGEILMALGRQAEAVTAFEEYLKNDSTDALGARVKLALLGAVECDRAISESYVTGLFDDYAPRFEEHLTKTLRYDVPARMAHIIGTVDNRETLRIADLGCGTGLIGAAFKDKAAWLEGVDLSPRMVTQAENKGLYDRLHTGNLMAWLEQSRDLFDLIIVADVLIYIGDLTAFFSYAADRLAKGGLLTFSIQLTGDDKNYILGTDHRYAHSDFFIKKCAAEAQMVEIYGEPCPIRLEAGKEVSGMIYVFKSRE
jgi:predicted TPR repeat methyltransferase